MNPAVRQCISNPNTSNIDERLQKPKADFRKDIVPDCFCICGGIRVAQATGLHPFAMQLVLPSSNTPVQTGDMMGNRLLIQVSIVGGRIGGWNHRTASRWFD